MGERTYLGSLITLDETQFQFNITFEWDIEMMGVPGAFFIENFMQSELFLVSLTLNDVPNLGTINFVCNSWIYNAKNYQTERIFFTNKVMKNIISYLSYMLNIYYIYISQNLTL